MKYLLVLLLLASPLAAQTPITATAKAGSGPSVIVTTVAGDYLLTFCNSPDAIVSDSAGNVYANEGAVSNGDVFETVYMAGPVAAKQTSVTCTSAQWVNEIYVVKVSGATSFSPAANFSGAGAPTGGRVTTTATGDFIIGYCQSGSCGKPVGWATVSSFDGNMVASLTPAASGSLTPAFSPSSEFTETFVVFHTAPAPPAPFVWIMPGLGTITFPMAIPPACSATDGTCSITVMFCDSAGNCNTGTTGTLYLIKTVSAPSQQTQQIPVAVVKNP